MRRSTGTLLSVAFKSDVLWTKTETERVQGMMASEGSTSRTRLGIEASRTFETGRGAFTPSGSVGIRHDGGDTETGTGIEIGMGLAFRAGRLSTEAQVDMLASHADDHYEAWSASLGVRYAPRAGGRGLSLTLRPVWGAPGSESLVWDANRLVEGGREEAHGMRLAGEIGFGLGAPVGVVTPYAGLGIGNAEERTVRVGTRWTLTPDARIGWEARRRVRLGRRRREPSTS